MNMTYNYTAGKDNGQIASSADAVTGETITYTYDSLKRLTNASSTPLPPVNAAPWSGAYTYDGFGNLTGMTPGGLSVTVNAATNQIQPTNIAYDGNGNVTQFGPSGSLTTLGYDAANRVATVNANNAYAYDSANQRTYLRNSSGLETLYIYGPGGKKLATYTITGTNPVAFTLQSENVYFAGKLISAEGNTTGGNAVAGDGLGSMRWSAATGAHTYFPYGIEYSTDKTPATDTENYATYTADSLTGLDYAMNRYYASFWARFMTPDPSNASMDVRTPLSLNRYMYTLGDPVAGSDPSGLIECAGDDGDVGNGGDLGEDSDDVVRRRTGPHALCSAAGGGGGGGPVPDPDPSQTANCTPGAPGCYNVPTPPTTPTTPPSTPDVPLSPNAQQVLNQLNYDLNNTNICSVLTTGASWGLMGAGGYSKVGGVFNFPGPLSGIGWATLGEGVFLRVGCAIAIGSF
jgi:RHS repeat-associated protein